MSSPKTFEIKMPQPTKNATPAELATRLVGDGKKPNKYFVTLGFGWYVPKMEPDSNTCPEMVQAEKSLQSVTIGPFSSKAAAERIYESLELTPHIDKVTGETLSQIIIEDRLTGVVKEKRLMQKYSGYQFFIDELQ